jgi:hypothetical protein
MLENLREQKVRCGCSAHRGGDGVQPRARVRRAAGGAGAAAGVHGHARAHGARLAAARAPARPLARARRALARQVPL